jgi:hypothetical protein
MIINNIAIPDKLNLFGKPWEIPHLDKLWNLAITSILRLEINVKYSEFFFKRRY